MSKRIVVVGAGIIGASVAWHLTKAGCAVTILDAGKIGGQATAHSFAWINASWGNPEFYVHFRLRSMRGWRRLQSEIPGLAVDWCGGILWDRPQDDLAAYAIQHGRWGYGVRWIDRQEILDLEPNLVAPPPRALHVAEEGMVEPVAAARTMLDAAIANGAQLRETTAVASLHRRNGRIGGIATSDGTIIEADETIVAAGIGAPPLLSSAGIGLKIDAPPGLIMHSTLCDRHLLRGLVMAPDCHIRQTREGRLIAGADYAGVDPRGKDAEMAQALMAKVRATIRGAENLDVAFHTLGLRPTPADGFPAIGRIGIDGLYVTVMHSGITLAPIVGELAAREIVTGSRDPDLAPYDPGRPALA